MISRRWVAWTLATLGCGSGGGSSHGDGGTPHGAAQIEVTTGIVGARVREIRLSPADAQVILVTTYGDPLDIAGGLVGASAGDTSGGVYRSGDGGGRWQRVLGGQWYDVAFSPADPRRVYASGRAWARSDDAGLTWTITSPVPELSAGERVRALAADAGSPDVVYGAGTDSPLVSRDGARTWQQLGQSVPSIYRSNRVTAFAVGSEIPPNVYVGHDNAIEVSRDGGNRWDTVSDLWGQVNQIIVDPAHTEIVTAVLQEPAQIRRSRDGGSTWNEIPPVPPSTRRLLNLALDADRADHYLVNVEGDLPGEPRGIWETNDQGATWSSVLPSPGEWLKLGQNDVFGSTGFISCLSDLHLRSTGELIVATCAGILIASPDRRTVTKNNDGLADTPVFSIAQSPTAPDRLIAGALGVHRSDNAGRTWQRINWKTDPDGFDAERFFFQDVSFSSDGRFAYALSDEARSALFSVFRSEDGGMSWRTVLVDEVSALATHATDPARVYVATQVGLLTSSDAGDTWTEVGGLPADTYWEEVSPALDGSDVVAARSYDGDVFLSENGGADWRRLELPIAVPGFVPHTSIREERLIRVVSGAGPTIDLLYSESLYRSQDGGRSWNILFGADHSALFLFTVDSWAREHMAAFALGGDAYVLHVSDDAGRSWREVDLAAPLAGTNADFPTAIEYDRRDPSLLRIGTHVHGVVQVRVGG